MNSKTASKKPAQVAVIMGSQNDLPTMQAAIDILEKNSISVWVQIVSAHRTPEWMVKFAKEADKKGVKILIAGAGGAAHLPGMVAALTPLPVIGVPVEVGPFKGLDALLSIWQMPKGVPVATVGINNSANAALLAMRILGISTPKIKQAVTDLQKSEKARVLKQNKNM